MAIVQKEEPSSRLPVSLTTTAILVAILALALATATATLSPRGKPSQSLDTMAAAAARRAPVWFIAHGGPPTLFQPEHPAYQRWTQVGHEIRSANLNGLVVISAHWQAEHADAHAHDAAAAVQVNVDPSIPIIYDYYGFPDFFYKLAFHATNPADFSTTVIDTLRASGIEAHPTSRGIDHGIFIPFKAAFHHELDPASPHVAHTGLPPSQDAGRDAMPHGVPLCQVSLPSAALDSRTATHASLRLGRALRPLRDHGIGIVLSGQPVHNLRLFMAQLRWGAQDPETGLIPPAPDGVVFSRAISDAVMRSGGKDRVDDTNDKEAKVKRDESITALLAHPLFKRAHPSDEHWLPMPAAIGATYATEPVQEHTPIVENFMAWNMYKWG